MQSGTRGKSAASQTWQEVGIAWCLIGAADSVILEGIKQSSGLGLGFKGAGVAKVEVNHYSFHGRSSEKGTMALSQVLKESLGAKSESGQYWCQLYFFFLN